MVTVDLVNICSSLDHVSSMDHTSSKEDDHMVMGGTFAGVGDFSAVSMTTPVSHDDYSNLVKDDKACIR